MSEPTPLPRTMKDVAQQSADESTEDEREAVGDQPDAGDLVADDHSQSAPR
jgi:hypothetical protein